MSIPLPGRSYCHGISEINYEYPIYSPSLLITVPPINIAEYEWREHEFIGVENGSRICVQQIVKDGYVFRYTTTKQPGGWLRRTYICRKGEEELFPCKWGPHDIYRE
jgi:hypothetical protein